MPLTHNKHYFLLGLLLYLFCLEINAASHMGKLDMPVMADTICTNTFRDTFITFSADKATAYSWNLPIGASLVSQPNDTTVIINWRNTIIGNHQLCVIAENTCGESQSTCIDVHIQHCNDAPIANDDIQSTFHEIPITIFVQNNDISTDGDNLSTQLDASQLPTHGSLDLIGEAIQYTPEDSYTGVDSFQYIICDSGFPTQCDTASVYITIDHQAPVATNDLISTPSNTPIAIPVLNNDEDPEGSELNASIDEASVPFNGTVTVIDQEVVYTPNDGFTGTDRFEYQVCDSNNPQKCDRATVTVMVLNEGPVATDDEVKVAAETTTTLTVLGNDSDKEAGDLTVTLDDSNPPTNGMVTIDGTDLNYTPNPGFTGVDSLDYIICDDGVPTLCDTATLIIQVINDAPIANDDLVMLPSNTDITIEVLDNDIDLEGGTLTVLLHPSDTATQGEVTLLDNEITYSPTTDYTGEDTLQYYVCDNGVPVQCDTATVFITIDNLPPIATPDELGTTSGDPVCYPVLANDSDAENGQLVLSLDPNKLPISGEVIVEDGQLCYTPDDGFSGLDSLCYIICDDGNPVMCDTARLLITVDNQAPVAVDDQAITTSDEAICIAVLDNDEDAENGILSLTLDVSKLPQNGTVTIEEKEVCYTPSDNFSGTDSLCYIICDDGIPMICDTAQIIITIDNQAPIAVDDILSTKSGEETCINVLANDLDADNGSLSVSLDNSKLPENGTATISNNEICFLPEEGFSGLDSLCYIICDNGMPSKCDTATLYITTDNQAPIAVNDVFTTNSDEETCLDVMANDLDAENGELTIRLDENKLPQNGTATISNNEICFLPNEGFTGLDSLCYIICDNGTPPKCDTAIVFITVDNQPPIAVADDIIINSDSPTCIDVLANDTDAEVGTLTVSIDAGKLPQHGTVTVQNNEICYTPETGFSGLDSLCYIVCDDGMPIQCDTTKIIITIDNQAPVAVNDIISTDSGEESCVDVLANDTDSEKGNLTITIDASKLPKNGTATIKENEICFEPNEGFSGVDSLCYIICDDGLPAKCDTAVIYIGIDNQPPTANDDSIDGVSAVVLDIPVLDNDSDPENMPLIVSLDSTNLPTNGTVVIKDDTIAYLSNTGFTGVDQLDYIICDPGEPNLCDTATVFIHIINQAPDAMDDEIAISSTDPICIEVLANDNDPEFGLVTVFIDATKLPQNGIVSVVNDEICYTPNEDFSGIDSLCYVICDDGNPSACDTAKITITVINQSPIAVEDVVSIDSGEEICVEVLANDLDAEGGDLTVTLDPNKSPQNGEATVADNKICYVPNEGFSGLDSLCYIICDDGIPTKCDTATLIVAIQNQMPIAVDDTVEGLSGEELEIMVGLNDLDAENGTITFSEDLTSLPANGTIELLGDLYIYTPNDGFTGKDEFDYILCDNGTPVLCDTATVFITIINQAPIATADMVMTPSDEEIAIPILQNDSDPENGELSISINPNSLPANGSLLVEEDQIVYTPFKGFNGDDTFEYIICDDGVPILCDTTLVTILVVNDAPIAVDDNFTTNSNTPIVTVVVDNDFDPENGELSVRLDVSALPTNGSVVQQGEDFTYTPNNNFTGIDTFDYILCDDGQPSQCDTATVTITVDNLAPNAASDIVTTQFETPINIAYISNDSDPEEGNLTVIDSPEVLPTNGTVVTDNNELIYTPNKGFTGIDEFSYSLCDDGTPIRCDTALITVIVPNTKPVALDDYVTTPYVPFEMIGVLENDTDAEHVQFDVSLENTNLPRHGIVQVIGDSIRYEPDFLFVGVDSFDYIICDTGTPILCDTATVFVQVSNDPPIAINDTFKIVEDQLLIENIQSNDSDPNGHHILILDTLLKEPTLGKLTLQPDGQFQYVPFANISGTEEFTYVLCDSVVPPSCDTATVFIEITSVEDQPLALDDVNLTLKNISVEGEVLTNDSDPDGDDLVVNPIPIELPANGELLLSEDGIYEYIPTKDFIGEDYFTYEVCDDASPSQCDTASVQIIVTDESSVVNRPPLGVNDYIQSTLNATVINNVLQNDADPDGDLIGINARPLSGPTIGNLELSTDGTFTYYPEEGFTGLVSFEYILFDLASPSLMDTALVTIEILPNASNSVFAVDDAFLGKEDISITGQLLSNDFDPENNQLALTTTPIQLPKEGTVILQEDGTFIYAPKKDYFGADYFIYEVCDDGIEMVCDEATVVLNILPVNDTLCTNNLPIPTIVANKTACSNDTIHLFSASPYPPVTLEEADTSFRFLWLNGNGETIAITKESEIKFPASDSLAIPPFSMKAQQGICTSGFSNFLNIDIVNQPSITITSPSNNNTICHLASINLNTPLLPNVQYAWTVKDDSNILSTGRELIINDLDSTTTFELTVTSEICDLFSIADVTVNVLPRPEVVIEIANDDAICAGSTLELEASTDSLSTYQYFWTGPNNYFSTASAPIIRNVNASYNGNYQLVIEDDKGCSNTASLEIITIPEEVAPPTIIGDNEFCTSDRIELELLELYDSNVTVEWINKNEDIIGSTTTLSIPADDSLAIAPFRVSITKEGCTSSFSAPYTIETFQPAIAKINSPQNTLCKGSTISLIANTFENANYEWRRLGNNTLFSTESTTILANIQNDMAVELTVYQEVCPSFISKDTLHLSIASNNNLQPTASFVLNDDCSPTNLTLNANVPSSVQEVRWVGPNGFTSLLPIVTIGNATEEYNGTYQVSVTDSIGCTSTTTLLINDLQETVRIPTITSVEGAVCENSNILLEAPSYEGNVVQYVWYENGRLLSDTSGFRLFIDDATLNTVYDLEIKVDGCTLKADPFTPIVLENPKVTIAQIPTVLCAAGEEDIRIPASVVGGQLPYNLEWTGPNGFVSAIVSPTIINANSEDAGTYTLSISDQNNCKVVASTEIDIQEGIPTPIIQKEGGSCVGDAIRISATSYEGLDVLYTWDFPENIGISSISASDINIPTSNENYIGTYQVTATLGDCVVQSDSFNLALSNRPVINPTAEYEAAADCEANDLKLFANEEAAGLDFEWIGPDGFQSSIANPIIVAATPSNNGIYEVTVTSPEGCSVTKATALINQINAAQSKPILQVEGSPCEGELMVINAPIYQGESVTYNWLLNGALISNENSNELQIRDDFTESDEYQLLVEVDGCMLTSDLYTPKITALPTITNISKSAIYCEGETVFLTAQSDNSTGQEIEYIWRGPNSFEYINTTDSDSFNLTLPFITSVQSGSYALSLRMGACESETVSVLVSIRPGLIAPELAVNETIICAGNTLEFTATSTANTMVEYEWYVDEEENEKSLVATTTSPTLVIDNATSINSGNYSVRITNGDCSSSFSNIRNTIVFDENTVITPLSTATEATPGCYGDQIQLSVPFYPNTTYDWNGPAGFGSDRNNPVIEDAAAYHEGDYSVVVSLDKCLEVLSQPVTVKINPKPITPIVSSNSPICEKTKLVFNVDNASNYDPSATYEWYNAEDVLVADIEEPVRVFNNVPTEFSNSYYAIIKNDGCPSERSNSIDITISSPEDLVADAGSDQQFCAAYAVNLKAAEPVAGEGEWRSLNGAIIEDRFSSATTGQNLIAGKNTFIWTVSDPACGASVADTVEVIVGTATLDQAIAGKDLQVCEQNSLTLEASPLVESQGRWTQSADQISEGVTIASPTNPTTNISGLSPGNSYQFTWTISQNNCPDFESDDITIEVSDIPNETAIVSSENLYLCEENETLIAAEFPILSEGVWSILDEASDSTATPAINPTTIASATSSTTYVEGLPDGRTTFVWSLSNGGCEDFSSDTLHIFSGGSVSANPDDYLLNFNDSIVLNIFENDIIGNEEDIQFIITRYPEYGTITENETGELIYTPSLNYFGRDHFRYKLCTDVCEEKCDTAVVNIGISGVEGSGACFIPNTISPNEDGNNDQFIISCLDDFPNNTLSIFNRWGDKVFEEGPYQNNWQGEYERQPLPAGTYFYVLHLTEEGQPLQGFITLFR